MFYILSMQYEYFTLSEPAFPDSKNKEEGKGKGIIGIKEKRNFLWSLPQSPPLTLQPLRVTSHLISPHIVTSGSNIKVMRIKKMINDQRRS